MPVLTSATHPIRVDFVPSSVHGLPGKLGMTFAPGKSAKGIDGHWDRDLVADLARLRTEYATDVLVSLIEDHELTSLRIKELPTAAMAAGISVDRFAIPDAGVPADPAEFVRLVERTIDRLRAGMAVVIHCRGGLGRTGLLAAACLRALGVDADRAIAIVRSARPGTIENEAQANFVRTVDLGRAGRPVTAAPSLSRFLGTFLGGAIGDSLGEPVEFVRTSAEIALRFGTTAPVKLGYAHPPLITDDTQMSLFAAEGILVAGAHRWDADGRVLVHEVQAAFIRWLSTQERRFPEPSGASKGAWLATEPGLYHRRAPGNTCLSALQAQLGGRPLASVANVLNDSKGCGAVMRAAPFGLAARTREQAFRWARDTGAITHGHPSGHLSAAHFAAVVWGVARGESLAGAIVAASVLLASERGHEETTAVVARAMALVPNGPPSAAVIESLGGGWVGEEALAITLLCATTCQGSAPEQVADALWRSVAHAGDSDSTGSMVGNVLGAMYGAEALPAGWVGELEMRGVIERVAGELCAAVEGDSATATRG